MPETTDSILKVGEGSSVLGIRVGVLHMTISLAWKGFHAKRQVQYWGGGVRSVSRGDLFSAKQIRREDL